MRGVDSRSLVGGLALVGGAVIGAIVLAVPAHAATVGPIPTEPAVTTSTTTAESTLVPGQRPGPFYGAPDRTRGNVYGAWTDETETRARWVLESARGPWDTLEILDRLGPGQRLDCAAGVQVRATGDVDPETGYLVGLVDVPAERVEVQCSETQLQVRVAPVGDEIVEVTVTSTTDQPPVAVSTEAEFVTTRAVPGTDPTPPVVEPGEPSPSPEPSASPEPSTSPEPSASSEPSTPSSAVPALPARLAETGVDAMWSSLAFASALVVAGAVACVPRWRRARSRG